MKNFTQMKVSYIKEDSKYLKTEMEGFSILTNLKNDERLFLKVLTEEVKQRCKLDKNQLLDLLLDWENKEPYTTSMLELKYSIFVEKGLKDKYVIQEVLKSLLLNIQEIKVIVKGSKIQEYTLHTKIVEEYIIEKSNSDLFHIHLGKFWLSEIIDDYFV